LENHQASDAWGWEEGAGPWVINATTSLWAGKDLWLTTDSGATWKQLNPGPSAFWGFNGGEVQIHPIQRDKNGNYYLTATQGVITSPDGLSWSLIPNSGGRKVGLIIGGGKLYAFDQWSASLRVAKENQPLNWTSMTPPPSLPDGSSITIQPITCCTLRVTEGASGESSGMT
jgi:hypothetical protein